MNWKQASTLRGHAITILIQSVFFSVRSSELSGAGPAVPTSCGNWPSDRYAVIYDCEIVHVRISFTSRELIYAWNYIFLFSRWGFVYGSCWHLGDSWQLAASCPWSADCSCFSASAPAHSSWYRPYSHTKPFACKLECNELWPGPAFHHQPPSLHPLSFLPSLPPRAGPSLPPLSASSLV